MHPGVTGFAVSSFRGVHATVSGSSLRGPNEFCGGLHLEKLSGGNWMTASPTASLLRGRWRCRSGSVRPVLPLLGGRVSRTPLP